MLVAILLLIPSAQAEISVVVSIRPLQLIAAALLGAYGEVRVLIPPAGSPHHYTMTPSDRLALESAQLLVYVGEQLETELHEVIDNLGGDRPVLEIMGLPGLNQRLLAGSHSLDPHVWLDSRNGLLIAAALRDRLTEIDAANAGRWAENYAALETELLAAEGRWHEQLRDLSVTPYAVYHDAIGYFESQFNLTHSVALVDDPEIQPGMRHMVRVRQEIARKRPVCLFTDVTSRQNTIDTLFASYSFRQRRLDLLGERLTGSEGYPQLLDNLVYDISNCLKGDL